jgi:protein involved in polysaccharide export with SLBB domain
MKQELFFSYFLYSCSLCLLLLSGCAPYSTYPPGTVKQINPVVEKETVNLTSLETGTLPMRDEYLLGPGDILFVNVSGKPELSTVAGSKGSRVDGAGNVHLPLVGSIRVSGLTLEQAQTAVQSAFKSYLKDPWSVIEIGDYRTKQVFIFGAVKRPGPVPMLQGGLNLAQAIATAELRDSYYDFNHVRIIRSLTATQGELMVVDFDKILQGDALPFPLRDGDIIYVPKNRFGNWNDALAEILPSLQTVSAVLQPFVQIRFLERPLK